MSDSLQPHVLQRARLLCPPLSPRVLINLMCIELMILSNHLILCCLLFLCLQSFPVRVFSNELDHPITWPKYWSFNKSPSSEYLGLVSFRIDWFDSLSVQGTLRSPLQNYSLKASILLHSSFFFLVLLSQLYITTGKTIALTIWTFVREVMSLLFNMLSRFVIAFPSKSECL